MELEEAHDNLLMLKHFTELEKQENWQDYVEAIDIVLKELDKKDKVIKEAIEFINEFSPIEVGNYQGKTMYDKNLNADEINDLLDILEEVEVENE